MRYLYWSVVFLLVSLSVTAQIEEVQANYVIIENTILVEQTITLDEARTALSWIVPADAAAIEVSLGTFAVKKEQTKSIVQITSSQPFSEITIKYITEAFLEQTKDTFFILDLSPFQAEKISLTVTLPEQATLKYSVDAPETSLIPETDDIKTDGKRIILHWDAEDLAHSNSLLVIYNEPKPLTLWGWVFLGAAVVLLVMYGVTVFKRKKNHKEDTTPITPSSSPVQTIPSPIHTPASDLTRNLFEEERAIIEVLLKAKDHELWQKQLTLETGISKVKLSRKLRNLEAKGLIEKVPYGNTNKIRVKKAESSSS